MPWPNFHPSFSESIFYYLLRGFVANRAATLSLVSLGPEQQFVLKCITCNRNTILLASCISFSSCSWWASSCSSQDFSSSCTSCPREGHNPQRATSSKSSKGTGEMRQGTFFFSLHHIWLYKSWCAANQPVTDFFSVSSDLSSWGSPWFSGWSWTVSSLGVSVSWVITYSSLGEWAGLAELRLKQMVGTGRNECACMLPNEQQ